MLAFTKNFGTIFLGQPRTHLSHQPKEVAAIMRLPQYLILSIMLSVGLFPGYYFSIANAIVSGFVPPIQGEKVLIPGSLLDSVAAIGRYSLIFILLMIAINVIRRSITRKRLLAADSTWGCGYTVPSSRMQYTGKSYSKSLGKLLNFILLEKKKYKEIETNEIFPSERKHSSHYSDFFVTRIYDGIISRLLYFLNLFQFIQNGKIQLYILYGIFFIVLVFLGTIFKII